MSKNIPDDNQNQNSDTDVINGEFANDPDDPYYKAQIMLAEIKPGLRLSIYRQRPTWCSGFLESIDCMDDQPIDLDYIIREWGGQRLRLRLHDPETSRIISGCDLNLSSYKPMHRGRPCHVDDCFLPANSSQQSQNIPLNQQNFGAIDPIAMFQAMEKQRKSDFEQMQRALEKTQPVQRSSMDEMLEFGTKLAQMQKIFSGFANFGATQPAVALPATTDPSVDMIGQIANLIGALKGGQKKVSEKRRITSGSLTGSLGSVDSQSQKQPLQSVLSQLKPDEFSKLILTSLGSMSQNDREAVISKFLDASGLTGEFEDELDDDESDDNSIPGEGEQLQSDVDDDSVDR